jgi:hypothetical protein
MPDNVAPLKVQNRTEYSILAIRYVNISTEATGYKLQVGNSCRLLKQSILHSTNEKQVRYWKIKVKGERRTSQFVMRSLSVTQKEDENFHLPSPSS